MNKRMIICLSLAGTLLLGIIAFTASAFDGKNPANNNAELVIAREIKTEDLLVDYDIQIPGVDGLKDTLFQEELNNSILNKALNDIGEVEEQARELKALTEKEGWDYRQHEIYIDFDLKSNNSILSFIINTYKYTGGAHGIARVDCYNIDVEKSAIMEIKDLFKEGVDFKSIINEEISAQIGEQEKDENLIYFSGEEGFNSISDDQDFYIQDNNLVILFQRYEIAPGYMGTPEFKISFQELCGLLLE
ncbi:MAG TPA: DUF3298 and DUF4163 domain-containing protein [Atribacterota bacterium]|nr:DUF3298 and DUF4163 domain-containing protein [Atribacterota bacterium]